MNKLFTCICGAAMVCTSALTASAQTTNDSIFTARTVEGVNVTYKIISNEDKTCSVGNDDYKLVDPDQEPSATNLTCIAINPNTLGKLTIPETVNGYKVVKVGDGAFSFCRGLKTVVLPESLQEIGNLSFHYATNIDTLRIPNSVSKMGSAPFMSCQSLKSINIPTQMTNLADAMFEDCRSLENIDLPSTLQSLSGSAFYGCKSLKSIVIPETIDSIPDNAFYDCEALSSVSLPVVKYIGFSTFGQCFNLSSLDLKEGLTYIGDLAFGWGSGFTSINLPSTLTHIGTFVFALDTKLTSIYSYMKVPIEQGDLGNHQTFSAFDGATNGTCKLYVPIGCLDNYLNDTGNWNIFGKDNTVEFVPKTSDGIRSISAATANDAAGRYFNLSGEEVPANSKGILIHNGKKILVK